MRSNNLHKIQRSNDRPNVNLVVRQLKYAASSFKDLSFLIPEGWKLGDPQPKPFVIFFDNKGDAVQSIKYLRRRLPREYRTKIKWFLSDMTTMYKEDAVDKLRSGDVWGICATDAEYYCPRVLIYEILRPLCSIKQRAICARCGSALVELREIKS